MATETYDKTRIALGQLETALRLFEEKADLFSVVTLAGAAEEILGERLRHDGKANALTTLESAAEAMHRYLFPGEKIGEKVFTTRANRARNSFKHLGSPNMSTVTVDVEEEAIDMLTRAIDNYWDLETALTPSMERFYRSRHSATHSPGA